RYSCECVLTLIPGPPPMVSRRLIPMIAAWLSAATAPNAVADTYYVRMRGSDRNSGDSLDRAWRTLDHAASRMRPGDTVYVGAGIYFDGIEPIVRGEPDAETRFVADTTGTHTGDAGPVVVADHRPVRVRDADRVH